MQSTNNPLDGFAVNPDDIRYIGRDLQRPECILAEPDGSLWVADARGGVVHILPSGHQKLIVQSEDTRFSYASDDASRLTSGTLPNGLSFARNGDIIISNFGTDRLELMTREGRSRVIADNIDGQPIGKVNFVLRDSKDRLWITVSTRKANWMDAIRPDCPDGYIALFDGNDLRVVADGFHFTNEIRLDVDEAWLYVAETCAPRVTRLRVADDGGLSDRQVFGPDRHDGLIDGIAFDSHGNLWGTHIMTDRIFTITPEGELRILLDDAPVETSAEFMHIFREGRVDSEAMLGCSGSIAPWCASVTFGGRDLHTVYVGSLRGSRIPYFRSPVAGLPPIHWHDQQQQPRAEFNLQAGK